MLAVREWHSALARYQKAFLWMQLPIILSMVLLLLLASDSWGWYALFKESFLPYVFSTVLNFIYLYYKNTYHKMSTSDYFLTAKPWYRGDAPPLNNSLLRIVEHVLPAGEKVLRFVVGINLFWVLLRALMAITYLSYPYWFDDLGLFFLLFMLGHLFVILYYFIKIEGSSRSKLPWMVAYVVVYSLSFTFGTIAILWVSV